MDRSHSIRLMNRRDFMFWITGGMFAVASATKFAWLDRLAARGMYTCTPDNVADYSCIWPKVEHKPDAERAKRNGQPPSEWLRSLTAKEIRKWLPTVNHDDMPIATVEGMTPMFHLTAHHSFVRSHITGLTRSELIKLHSCAHYGY